MRLPYTNHELRPSRLGFVVFCNIFFLLLGKMVFAQAQPPTVASFLPVTACQGQQVVITGTNFNNVTSVQLGNSNAAGYTVNNSNTITATVADNALSGNITVVTQDGSATSSTGLTILPSPKPGLTDIAGVDPFSNCDGNATYQLKVSNNSIVNGTGNQYTINWGDGSPVFSQTDWAQGAQLTHTYNAQGYFPITISITPANGCTKTASYQFYNGKNPLASFTTTTSTTGLCAPAPIEFQIGNWVNNTPGTRYEVDFGDGSPHVVLSHPLNATNTTHLLTHVYSTSSCPAADFTATLSVSNGCYTTKYTLNQIIIRKKPVADFEFSAALPCINVPVCFTNTSVDGFTGNSCSTAGTFLWNFGDGTTSTARNPGCHTYATAGTYTITLTASNTGCGSDVSSKTLTVAPLSPPPVISATPVNYCVGATAVPLTATGTALRWYTSATGGTGSITAPTPNTNSPGTFTWYVAQTTPGNCESPRVPVTVTVYALPVRPAVNSPVQLCLNQAAAPLTATGAGLKWYASDGTPLPSAPTPSTLATGTTRYFVTQTTNNCEGPRALIDVIVSPLPVAPVVNTPVIYCQGQPASPLTAPGSNLRWYTGPAGGIGATSAPTPSTAIAGTTSYYVSVVTGCGESPRSKIDVTVNAAPSANISYTPAALCNTAGSPAVAVVQTGTPNGTYSISPGGMTINNTTGAISPAGANAGVYTIRYSIPASGGCPAYSTTTSVTISSAPTAAISYPSLCTSDGVTSVSRIGTAGGTYTSTGGLTINATTGAITPATSTPGTYTVTYTIAASAPCPGVTATASVTVTQAPTAGISYTPAVLCNVVNAPATPNPPVDVTRTGTTGGTYSITPVTGLPINTTTGQIDPSGAVAGVYTIRYAVPGAGGCANYAATTTVTINNTPTATIAYPAICTADPLTPVNRTGVAGGTYTSTAGLIINSGTGAINPATSAPGTYTVTYTIAPSAPCPGYVTTTSVTVTQAPNATIGYAPAILCNVVNTATTPNLPVDVTHTGTTGGVYTITPATGLSINTTSGQLDPSGAVAGTYTIRYTVAGSGGCANFAATTTVTVNNTPSAVIAYPAICTADALTAVNRTGATGGVYSSTAGLVINGATGAITPGASLPGTYTVTYTIAPSAPCPGFTTTTNVTVTQAPSATITYNPAALCNVANTPATPNLPVSVTQTGTAGGTYTITPAMGLPLNTTTGQITPAGATAGTYTIRYTVTGTGGCANFTASTTVTISNAASAIISYGGTPYCGAMNTPQPVTFAGTTGGTFSAAAGLSINANTGAINPALSTPGVYTVTYMIAASLPCPGFSTTATVQVVEMPVVSFPVSSLAICSGETTVFTPSSTVPNTTYTWAVTGTLPPGVAGISSGTLTGANPLLSLSFTNTGAVNRTLTIRVVPTNPLPIACSGAAYDLTLLVRPVVPAPVTDTANFCMNTPPTALQVTPLPGNTLRWYNSGQVLLPATPVINTNVAGLFTYYVSQVTVNGCESPKSEIVAVVHPVAKIISATHANPITCGIPSGAVVLDVLDVNNNAIPNLAVTVHYNKFQVSQTHIGSTDATGKITIPLTAGTYSGFTVETSGGCTSQGIPDVFILRDPTPPAAPVAGFNPPVCLGSPLTLTALSATSTQAGPIDYVWAGPAFGQFADTSRNTVVTFPTAAMSDAGTYVVYAIQNNCISPPVDFQVTINQAPSKPVITTRTPLCVGDNLVLQASSSISGGAQLTYRWTGPGTGFPVNGPMVQINSVRVQDAGRYAVTVSSPVTGCTVTSDTLIQVGAYPVVRFTQDTLILPTGYRLNLNPVIANETEPGVLPIRQYKWTPSQDLVCNDAICSSPVLTVKNSVCYNVEATNIYGCAGSDDICIRVFCQNSQVFIPNAFAPNGNVPENRILMVRATGISSVKSFRVFNRWGQIVFERNNFAPNSTDYGWDGRVKGKPADTGVYIYTVDVICENGVPYSFKGNVTLF